MSQSHCEPQPVTTERRKRRRASTKPAVKPPDPDWLWTEDRQIRRTAFAEIEALAGRAFTLDAAANDAGDNAMCDQFCSPANSFLDAQHAGHIWINPPFTQLLSFMQHYLHCPSSTSACILIPGYLPQELKPMLTNMRLLKRFTKGTSLFTTPTKSGARVAMPGTHWPVYIHTDVAADTSLTDTTVNGTPLHRLHNAAVVLEETPPHGIQTTDQHLTMLLEGSAANSEGVIRTLVDTGASANFVSPQLLARLGTAWDDTSATSASLRVADNTEAKLIGKASAS